MRYIQYLEEQRTRDERNHKLLAVLDRVMNKLALISAKKDRLNVLRVSYHFNHCYILCYIFVEKLLQVTYFLYYNSIIFIILK